jgi:hypothetical protein
MLRARLEIDDDIEAYEVIGSSVAILGLYKVVP